MKLSPAQRRAVLDNLDDIFYNLKARMLGKFFKGPKIYFEVVKRSNPLDTVEGIFNYTMKMLYGSHIEAPDDQVEALAEVTGNYLDEQRLKISNKVMSEIASADSPETALASIRESVDKISEHVDMLVANEARTAQAYAEREGITRVASSIGIEDPTVCKVGIIDDKMCPNCKKLWHTEKNINIPKVYKLSELKDGYMKDHKNPYPTVGPTHPHCRHSLTMVPPNFGFDSSGTVDWKGFGWDEYAHQHSNE